MFIIANNNNNNNNNIKITSDFLVLLKISPNDCYHLIPAGNIVAIIISYL
jgi:hypothetical protein